MCQNRLEELAQEFCFSCRCKRCLERAISNYQKLFGYLLRFLQESYNATTLEEIRPVYIQKFLLEKLESGRKPPVVSGLKIYKKDSTTQMVVLSL
ncbi:hypothetical protein [Anaerotruncus rubiinfantis]|uniref:hypothetical protein n=1 Tax=Anaerotruncus rubiinfantis TaxID=1720200 RepID=UPI0034A1CAF8